MLQPGRKYSSANGYRYGFNGQEKDKENAGEGNSYTAEFWQYDARIGRRWNVEPLTQKYPQFSAYITFGDNPVLYADKDGKDKIITITIIGKDGKTFEVERRDKNYSDKYKDPKFGGGYNYYKQDLSIHLVIDNSKGVDESVEDAVRIAMADPGKYKVSSEYVNTKEIDATDYWLGWAMTGDESGTLVSDRWRVFGKNSDGSWNKGLPNAEGKTVSVDLGGFLDLLGEAKSAEKPIDLIKLLRNEKTKKVFKALEQITDAAKKAVATAEATEKSSPGNKLGGGKIYSGYRRGSILYTGRVIGNVRVDSDSSATCCQDDKKATDTLPVAKNKNN